MASTRLSMLLKHLHINVKDLAKGIHVDPSLVSRWNTGGRSLNKSSDHLNNIVSYIISSDKNADYKNIEIFFGYYSPGIIFTKDKMHGTVKDWLSMRSSAPQNSCLESLNIPDSFSEVGIIKGEKEKKSALLNFLDVALACSEEKDVYIMIGLDTDDFLEKGPFYDQWISKLHKLLARNRNIFFIYNHSFSSFANDLKGFFSLCSSGLYHAYYLPRRGNLTNSFNLCIIEDTFALTDFTASAGNKKPVCFSFTDKDVVTQLKIEYMNYLSSCHTLNDDALSSHEQIYNYLLARITEEQDVYIYDECLFMLPVSLESFRKVLNYNDLKEDEIDHALKCYDDLIIKRMHCESGNSSAYHIIINIEELISEVSHAIEHGDANDSDNVCSLYPPLLLSPKDLMIPKTFYKDYVNELMRYINRPDPSSRLQIKFVNNAYMKNNTKIAFITKDRLFSLAFPHDMKLRNPMLFTNPTVISDTYNYLEEYWANIPDELNDLVVIKSQLERLLETIK